MRKQGRRKEANAACAGDGYVKIARYRVTLYYRSEVSLTVRGENEFDAVRAARVQLRSMSKRKLNRRFCPGIREVPGIFGVRRRSAPGQLRQEGLALEISPLKLIRIALRGCQEFLKGESNIMDEIVILKNDVADALVAAKRFWEADQGKKVPAGWPISERSWRKRFC
jgi:hypothetical protein